jgi:hypothetical protein
MCAEKKYRQALSSTREEHHPTRKTNILIDSADGIGRKETSKPHYERPSGLEIKDPSVQQFPSPKTAICHLDQWLHKELTTDWDGGDWRKLNKNTRDWYG